MHKKKIILIIACFIGLFFCVLSSTLCLYVSFHQESIHIASDNDGLANFDYADHDFENERSYHNWQGNIEFYYNRWIVSDEDSDPMDCYINLPIYWNNIKLNGKYLPKSGYASYKVHCYNITPGTKLVYNYSHYPCKVFFNDTLVYQNGEPSKEHQLCAVPLKGGKRIPYEVDESGKVDVVVEVGNTNAGGLRVLGGFTLDGNIPFAYNIFIDRLYLGFFGIIISLSIISISLALSFSKGRDIIPVLLSILSLYFFSDDTPFYFSSISFGFRDYIFLHITTAILFSLFTLIMYHFYKRQKIIEPKRIDFFHMFIPFLAMVTSIPFTYNSLLSFISYGLGALGFLYLFYKEGKQYLQEKNPRTILYFYILSLFFALYCCTALECSGLLQFDLYGITVIFYFIILCLIPIIFFVSLRKTENRALVSLKFENNKAKLSQKILYSSFSYEEVDKGLDYIIANYNISIEKGRTASAQMANCMRTLVTSYDKDYSTLREEINYSITLLDILNQNIKDKIQLLIDSHVKDDVPVPNLFLYHILNTLRKKDEKSIVALSLRNLFFCNYICVNINSKTISENDFTPLKDKVNMIHGGHLYMFKEKNNFILIILYKGE